MNASTTPGDGAPSRERPILFSAPMVRALLDGTKTQTRRIAKEFAGRDDLDAILKRFPNQNGCPYGKPGDRLWVRETFRGCRAYEVRGYAPRDWGNKPLWFEADGSPPGKAEFWAERARPSIHMPRWASRITLEITGVRVERLQDISEADAKAEGAHMVFDGDGAYRRGYGQIWEAINGAGSWAANPFVWVVAFQAEGRTP